MIFEREIGFDRARLIKWMVRHRTRVSNKLSVLGNDLAIRGRRHDNSYTDDTESTLFIKAKTAKDISERERYSQLLNRLHEQNNDYLPNYHDRGLSGMNLVQLMEFICDGMATFEEDVIKSKDDGNTMVDLEPKDYYDAVLERIPEDTPEVVKDMIQNTIDYIVDKNSAIKRMIEKREMLYRADMAKRKEEALHRGETKEEQNI